MPYVFRSSVSSIRHPGPELERNLEKEGLRPSPTSDAG